MVSELGNARLLTMQGDGHCAYGGNSACIDDAVQTYFEKGTLPKTGTVCQQEVPFGQPEAAVTERVAVSAVTAGAAAPRFVRAWAARGRR